MNRLKLADEEQVLKLLAERGRIHAVIEIRRIAGCDLRAALDVLTEIAPKLRVGADDEYVDWEVFAIGPFNRGLEDCLDYPIDFYAATRDGAAVITTVLGTQTRRAWDLLTAHLGVDPDDLSTHALDVGHADPEVLAGVVDGLELGAFIRLRDAGFQFYFCPGWALEGA